MGTVYSRFRKWLDDGILDNLFRIFTLKSALEELSLDSTILRTYQYSTGAKKEQKN